MIITGSSKQRSVLAMLIFNKLKNEGVIAGIIANMPKNMQYTNVDPEDIANALPICNFTTKLSFTTPWNPWSKMLAMVETGNWKEMWLSTRRLDRNLDSLCGSIAHEWGHCLEFWWKANMEPGHHFNHGSNTRKINTFQYQLGIRVKNYVKQYRGELLRDIGYLK